MRTLASLLRLTAASLLVAAVGLTLPVGAASAATCTSGNGVSVVVDFHELGGGVQTACLAGGGRSGSSLFTSAGFALTEVQRQPGFVCRVAGKPASDPCVNTPPANAYWALYWADGKSGSWTYASTAVGSLTVPEGGYVALSWSAGARSAPGVTPAAHTSAPTPTPKPSSKPSSKPTSKPSGKPTRPATPDSSAAGPSASGRATPGSPGSGTPATGTPSQGSSSTGSPSAAKTPSPGSAAASPSATQPGGAAGRPTKSPGGVDGEMLPESAPAADPAAPADGGLPAWVGPVVVVALFAAGGAVAVVRRRRSQAP